MELIIRNGVLEKCKYYGEVITHLEIPEGVRQIGADSYVFGGVFAHMRELESVVLPKGITRISAGAFRGCSKLKQINFPEGIESIGYGAFRSCNSLKAIHLPETLREIGDEAFSGCGSLGEAVFPESVTTIHTANQYVAGVFSGCRSLKFVKLSKHIVSIPRYMFLDCPELITVETSAPIKAVGQDAFGECAKLKYITLTEDAAIAEGAFYGCEAMGDAQGMLILGDMLQGYFGEDPNVQIPETVRKIARKAFYQNSRITSVTIPKSVKSIGDEAFWECGKLESVHIPESVTKMGRSVFQKCTALTQLHLPESLKTIPPCTAYECSGLKKISISSNAKAIESGAFYGCANLPYIRIPETVAVMSTSVSRSSVIVPKQIFDSYDQVCSGSFWEKGTALYTMRLDGVNTFRIILNDRIGKFVLDKKQSFSMTSYDSVLEANDARLSATVQAFAMLYRLKFPDQLTEERKNAFIVTVCKQVKRLAPYINAVPEDDLMTLLKQIGAVTERTEKNILVLAGLEEAPSPKKKETGVSGKKTLSQIKKEWGFTKLEDGSIRLDSYKGKDLHVEVPTAIGADIVSKIAACCFTADWSANMRFEQRQNRRNIRSVIIPEGIQTIESNTFSGCESLQTVHLPATLQLIKRSAFSGCTGLKNLGVNESVKVEPGALEGCRSMAGEDGFIIWDSILHGYFGEAETVTVPDGVKIISTNSFHKLAKLQHVIFPDSVTKLETSSFHNCRQLKIITFPAGIRSIAFEALNWCGYGETIRGYTGTAAETYAKDNFKKFESLGVVEKSQDGTSDFEITDSGTLLRYTGTDREVIIPDGVKAVGGFAGFNGKGVFEDNQTIQRVVIPDGAILIYYDAFRNCRELEEIVIPDSVQNAAQSAFEGTPWLNHQKQDQIYAGRVLICYREPENTSEDDLLEVRVREGTTAIGTNAFGATKAKLRVILPEGIKCLNSRAFESCTNLSELMVPAGLDTLGIQVFSRGSLPVRCCGGVLHRKTKLPDGFMDFYTGEPDDSAWILFYQTEKWKRMVYARMNQFPEQVDLVLDQMVSLLYSEEKPEAAIGNQAAAFAQMYCKAAAGENLESLLHVLKEKKLPAAKKLEKDPSFMEVLRKQEEDYALLHPVEAQIFRTFRPTPVFESVLVHIPSGIRYAGESSLCSPRVIAYIVSEYMNQIPQNRGGFSCYEKISPADRAAQALDQTQLLELLGDLAVRYGGLYSVPYARYADDHHVGKLLAMMRDWEIWSVHGNAGRQNARIARSGLITNDTKAAAMHFDKKGLLEPYAAVRGMDAQTLRDTVLSDFGFNQNREIRYDLGGNDLVVKLEKDLQLTLYDTNAGKTVKSVPRKNVDPARHEKVKKEIAAMKRNIKKILTGRRDLLFAQFLSGDTVKASDWKRIYIGNPVLGSLAQLLVWVQNGRTFLQRDTGSITSDGSVYNLGDEDIALAHPMEMDPVDLEAWRNYFIEHDICQPFEQIWECAADLEHLEKERYAGSLIPYYRFFGQEKHGITVVDEDFHNEIQIMFADCDAQVERTDWLRHMIEMEHRFEIKTITVTKPTRTANHVIAYLDKITVVERIKKDDVTIGSLLSGFTAAQIAEFIQLAAQENCTAVTAVLLDFQNRNFKDTDPFAQFCLGI